MIASTQISSFSIGLSGRESQDIPYAKLRADGSHVLAIADGVGGSSDGRRAAEIAITELDRWVQSDDTNLGHPFARADHYLKETVQREDKTQSLSTTLTAVIVDQSVATYGHVGDCRIYLLRGAGLRTITTDQTEIARLIALGVVSKERAKKYRRSNVLLSALGASQQYELECGQFELEDGDRILICSDGLYKSLAKREIAKLSTSNSTVQGFAKAIRASLHASPAGDDATAVVLEVHT